MNLLFEGSHFSRKLHKRAMLEEACVFLTQRGPAGKAKALCRSHFIVFTAVILSFI